MREQRDLWLLESQMSLGATELVRILAIAEPCDKDKVAKLLYPTTEDKMLAPEMPENCFHFLPVTAAVL